MSDQTKKEIIAIDRHAALNKPARQAMLQNLVLTNPEKNKMLCQGCAKCCLHINHEIDPPETDEDCDYIIWFLLHENISVWVDDENVWYIEFKTPCKALKNQLCSIYEKRPQVCREYLQDKCLNSDLEDDLSFNTPEEFLDYLQLEKGYKYNGFYKQKKRFAFWQKIKVIMIWILIGITFILSAIGMIYLFKFSLLMLLLLFLFLIVVMTWFIKVTN